MQNHNRALLEVPVVWTVLLDKWNCFASYIAMYFVLLELTVLLTINLSVCSAAVQVSS